MKLRIVRGTSRVAVGAIGAGVVVALAGGVGYATSQAAPATINACKNNQSGVLRAVRAGTRCRRGETALKWNQQGPAGRTGPRGLAGPRGPAGRNGVSGHEYVYSIKRVASSGGVAESSVSCPAGTVATGGGGYGASVATSSYLPMAYTGPIGFSGGAGWEVKVISNDVEVHMVVEAFCVRTPA